MEKILIVDDSPLQAAQLKSILDADYDVTVAVTAEEGLSHASSGDYSLILLDVVVKKAAGGDYHSKCPCDFDYEPFRYRT